MWRTYRRNENDSFICRKIQLLDIEGAEHYPESEIEGLLKALLS